MLLEAEAAGVSSPLHLCTPPPPLQTDCWLLPGEQSLVSSCLLTVAAWTHTVSTDAAEGQKFRLFGATGSCAACSKLIPAFEMVMRAKDNVYHLDCFACQLCSQRFCVGDKFFLKNNLILCQTDYEDGMMKEGYAPHVR
ncbi:LIM domain only protein 3 isoform X3 [Takifugu flavidus]|uniref:LIM domain only protein 3 isoform X3 n=1 Tax=Takifugu flavidus TaxID=433684 RepID=UPI00254497E7|nr:LIM domain only protein 3 isoform X3 [Takifugu flavidus]